MAKLLALEWDAREARVVVASTRGDGIVAEQAFAIALEAGADDAAANQREIGRQIAEALGDQASGGGETLVAVGRSSVELRVLTLPPAPAEETPDLVRFQAMRNFTSIGEDWPVDYVVLGGKAGEDSSQDVLASAMAPDRIQQIQTVCQQSELQVKRLVLRPFAGASLLRRFDTACHGQCRLMVDPSADEADLTVLADGQLVFMRTVRLPSSGDATVVSRALLGEIRRTISAAQNQLGGRRVDHVTLCGGPSDHVALKRVISEKLSLEVTTFDPFEHVRLSRTLKDHTPAHAGRYAPLLGMLCDEAADDRHAIDFLAPRRKAVPASQKGRNTRVAVLAAALLLVALLAGWWKKNSMDGEIADLKIQSTELDKSLLKLGDLRRQVSMLDDFQRGDVTWVDEFLEFAKRMPSSEAIIVTEMTFGATNEGGRVSIKTLARDEQHIDQLEQSLRFDKNIVNGTRDVYQDAAGEYPWISETLITVPPDAIRDSRSIGRKREGADVKSAEPHDAQRTQTGEAESDGTETEGTETEGTETEGTETEGAETEGTESEQEKREVEEQGDRTAAATSTAAIDPKLPRRGN